MKKHALWLGLAVVAAVLPAAVRAGGGGGGGPGGAGGFGGGGGGFGGGGPGGMGFQNQTDYIIQQLLQVTDPEVAAVLQPKVQKLVDTRSAVQSGGGRGRGGRGFGGGGPGGAAPAQTAVAKALADLQTVLNDTAAKPEDITAKVKAYREAVAKARDDYKAAQDDLKKILTVRQEGILVTNGYLE